MLCLYRCAEISEPFRGGVLRRPAIHSHVPSWSNFQSPARDCQYVLAEGSDAELNLADLDPACNALSPRVADKAAFRDWLTQPIGGALATLRARCEADGIPTQDLTAADLRGKALRRILRTIEAAQVLWGLRKAPAVATAIELLRADPLSTIGDLPLDVRQKAQAWFDSRSIDVSDFDLTTLLWVVVRRICDVLATQTQYGETDPSDDFNRANEDPIASPWEPGPGAWFDVSIISNVVRQSAGSTSLSCGRYSTSFGLEHFSQAQIATLSANCRVGVTSRMRTDADGDCYAFVAHNEASDVLRLNRVDDTGTLSFVPLGSDVAELAVATDTLRIESSGTTHTTKRNGTQKHQQTDATYNTAGTHLRVGLVCDNDAGETGAELDNWQGGDLTASPSLPKQDRASTLLVQRLTNENVRGFSTHLTGAGWWREAWA
jgi:hypothetical protein